MYFVNYDKGFGLSVVSKFDTKGEAKEFIKELATKGIREFYLSEEIPIKVKVEVEI